MYFLFNVSFYEKKATNYTRLAAMKNRDQTARSYTKIQEFLKALVLKAMAFRAISYSLCYLTPNNGINVRARYWITLK